MWNIADKRNKPSNDTLDVTTGRRSFHSVAVWNECVSDKKNCAMNTNICKNVNVRTQKRLRWPKRRKNANNDNEIDTKKAAYGNSGTIKSRVWRWMKRRFKKKKKQPTVMPTERNKSGKWNVNENKWQSSDKSVDNFLYLNLMDCDLVDLRSSTKSIVCRINAMCANFSNSLVHVVIWIVFGSMS